MAEGRSASASLTIGAIDPVSSVVLLICSRPLCSPPRDESGFEPVAS